MKTIIRADQTHYHEIIIGFEVGDVELASSTDPEFERNLAGVQAAACWVSSLC